MNDDFAPSMQASISGIHFFVGAGASHRISNQHDPDFPLGSNLFESFKSIITDAETLQLPGEQKSWALENFSKHTSIDDFLKTAKDDEKKDLINLVELGRKFVDQEISRCEYEVSEHFKRHNRKLIAPWIKSLLDFMTQDAENYEQAYEQIKSVNDKNGDSYPALNFATLNYDRVIEFSLLNYFVDKYPSSEDQITLDSQNLVQHHHGGLGTLQERPFGEMQIDRPPTLKFWFELSKDPQEWPIMNAMNNARFHSVFLGFGFHESITQRFGFNGKLPKSYISNAICDPLLEKKINIFLNTHGLENPIITTGSDCCLELIQRLVNEYSQ